MTKETTKLPLSLGPIHFIGIGGIGMSGIAEVLSSLGYRVQGSDIKLSKVTDRLGVLGIKIFEGHNNRNLGGVGVVVISSAIKPGNAELDEARSKGLPVVRRAEMLAELMRLKSNVAIAGTHGKTTTTTMVAAVLDVGGFDPTVINGGIIHAYGSNARIGLGDWMVVEADESDGTFTRLPATISIITNIDFEHLDHWGNIKNLRKGFLDFISNIPFYGVAICCVDNSEVRKLIKKVSDRRVVTYGFNSEADVRAINVSFKNGKSYFDILFRDEIGLVQGFCLPMPGAYNISNSLSAVAVARELGMPVKEISKALNGFKGVSRRFTYVGEVGGVTIIDDYGHHPSEISVVLEAARQITSGKIIAIHQPHRFTRLRDLFEDFCFCFRDADCVAIMDVYAAGEDEIEGASSDRLVSRLLDEGYEDVQLISGTTGMVEFIKKYAIPGDVVVCLGAGSISNWANALPSLLSK
ncbi:MAG: UDP-N-acetylmuramate--L-alanine ligase [Proteobacteria bacterium]|nr:UDP-N-acetylmuramate--L-alanine ligase [Pseudomonadota bacterium]